MPRRPVSTRLYYSTADHWNHAIRNRIRRIFHCHMGPGCLAVLVFNASWYYRMNSSFERVTQTFIVGACYPRKNPRLLDSNSGINEKKIESVIFCLVKRLHIDNKMVSSMSIIIYNTHIATCIQLLDDTNANLIMDRLYRHCHVFYGSFSSFLIKYFSVLTLIGQSVWL